VEAFRQRLVADAQFVGDLPGLCVSWHVEVAVLEGEHERVGLLFGETEPTGFLGGVVVDPANVERESTWDQPSGERRTRRERMTAGTTPI